MAQSKVIEPWREILINSGCFAVGYSLTHRCIRTPHYPRLGKVFMVVAALRTLKALLVSLRRWKLARDFFWSYIATWFLKRLNPSARTNIQKALQTPVAKVRDGHPHKTAAELRNAATIAMRSTAQALGYEPYVVSPSQRETDVDANRFYYQLNDFAQQFKASPVLEKSCIIMTDIDYYADMSYWLSFGVPVLIYTFVPDTAGGPVREGRFTITDNVVTTHISGGGVYSHELWDYNADSKWVPDQGDSWIRFLLNRLGQAIGVWDHMSVVMFTIDQYMVDNDRRVMSLVPFTRIPAVFWDDETTMLSRMELSVTGKDGRKFNHLMTLKPGGGAMVSVSEAGQAVSATLPESSFIGTRNRYQSLATKHLSDVVRFCSQVLDANGASILASYFSSIVGPIPTVIHQPGEFASHYDCEGANVVEDGKRYARRYASAPLTQEAVYPVISSNNEERCIEKRINLPQRTAIELMIKANPRKPGTPPTRFYEYANQFIKQLVPVPSVGTPLQNSQVAEMQDRPTQRLRSAVAAQDVEYDMRVASFQKAEAYSMPNDPRNISTVPTAHTLRLSAYTLSFKKDMLADCPWYMPGKTPIEISQAIQALADNNSKLVIGDYSRFDGTITRWLREQVEQASYLRWVKPEYVDELRAMLRKELDAKAYTKLGMPYSPGCSRLSGSPLTTDGNTIINAFVAFATLMEQQVPADVAFQRCGLFYGDDSIMTGMLAVVKPGKRAETALDDLQRVASTLGLQLKAELVPRGEPVMFLSRVFIDPWTTPDSFTDPLRTLLKIHTTVSHDDIREAGFQKASAYLVTDPLTPGVSDWAKCFLRCLKVDYEKNFQGQDIPYWVLVPEYRESPWPQASVPEHSSLVARMLTVSGPELRDWISELSTYTGSIMDIPSLQVAEIETKVPCTVDGDQRRPGVSSSKTQKCENITNGGKERNIQRQRLREVGQFDEPSGGRSQSVDPAIQTVQPNHEESSASSARIGVDSNRLGSKSHKNEKPPRYSRQESSATRDSRVQGETPTAETAVARGGRGTGAPRTNGYGPRNLSSSDGHSRRSTEFAREATSELCNIDPIRHRSSRGSHHTNQSTRGNGRGARPPRANGALSDQR